MKNLVAIIPARKADILFADKNILPLGNSNLLINKIEQLKLASGIDAIYLSTDSDEYAAIAKSLGVFVDKRPSSLSALSSDFSEFVVYIANKIESNHILWAPTITPFIGELDYSSAIKTYFDSLNNGYDSLISVKKLRRNLLDDNGPLNFSFYQKSQVFYPNIFEYVNGITIAPRLDMLRWRYNWGKNPIKIELDALKSLDICNYVL